MLLGINNYANDRETEILHAPNHWMDRGKVSHRHWRAKQIIRQNYPEIWKEYKAELEAIKREGNKSYDTSLIARWKRFMEVPGSINKVRRVVYYATSLYAVADIAIRRSLDKSSTETFWTTSKRARKISSKLDSQN